MNTPRKRLALELALGLLIVYSGRRLIDGGMELATQRFLALITPTNGEDEPDVGGAAPFVVDGAGQATIGQGPEFE